MAIPTSICLENDSINTSFDYEGEVVFKGNPNSPKVRMKTKNIVITRIRKRDHERMIGYVDGKRFLSKRVEKSKYNFLSIDSFLLAIFMDLDMGNL